MDIHKQEKNPLTEFENEMINVSLDDFVSLHISIIMLLGQYVKSLARPGFFFLLSMRRRRPHPEHRLLDDPEGESTGARR